MALTNLTKVSSTGIQPGLTIDTHNIEADGINVVGIVTATEFHGDGSNLTNVGGAASGVSEAIAIAYSIAL